jgi:hypothetical protein
MLALSPQLGFILEPFHPDHRPGICRARFPQWFFYLCDDNSEVYEDAISRMLRFRYSIAAELEAIRSLRDLLRIGRDWPRYSWHQVRRSRALVKDPIAFFSAPWLARRYDLEVVVLVRHPAAFASSLKRMGWTFDFRNWLDQPLLMRDLLGKWEVEIREAVRTPGDVVDQAALLWNVIYDVTDHLRVEHPDWIVLRHEDLSLEPEAEFEMLFRRLGLKFDESIRRRVAEATSAENPAEAPEGESHALRRDSRANVRIWQRRLSRDEVDRLRRRVDRVASRYYAPEEW